MMAIIIQARMSSTRLPGKIMKNLAGKPMLWHVVTRCLAAKSADKVIVATTVNSEDDVVENFCKENNFLYSRGSLDNVLSRYYETAKKFGADIVVRATSDCPLIDPKIIDLCVEVFQKSGADYISNVVPGERTFPRGLDVEVFKFSALEKACRLASENYEKEHATPYIWENKKNEFKIGAMIMAAPEYARNYRLTVDYPEDFELIEKIYSKFFVPGKIISIPEALKFLDASPDLLKINAHCEQKPLK
ncbi:MAG: glycosyltransferase family protein [Candidatus Giovannonibacteria bacterium]|nr:glycosyltransferase family protein [Candidatus Giovannonibacteria bacterium]